eukprot:5320494-Pleurochrysis_carterae.AAC.2
MQVLRLPKGERLYDRDCAASHVPPPHHARIILAEHRFPLLARWTLPVNVAFDEAASTNE